MISNIHKSVMLESCINSLDIKPNGIYVDMTLGRGGHFKSILNALNPSGMLIGIDQDQDAINYCQSLYDTDKRVHLVKSNFSKLRFILDNLHINHVDGILMDLGVSSPQIDNPDRGFSYHNDGPLDMRMDQNKTLKACDIVNNYSFKDLNHIFKRYGEIKNPSLVSNAIIRYRSNVKPITTTLELVEIIKASLPKKELLNQKHFACCYFQALRIEVNNELNILEETIELAAHCLKKNGKLAIITFHSLEDKIVIKKFQELSQNKLPKEVPIIGLNSQEFIISNIRPIVPDEKELNENTRARSSKLRVLTKC